MIMTKVIHVHLIFEKKNYYFGSISAIFDVLSEEEIGITKSSLLHAGMTEITVLLVLKSYFKGLNHFRRCPDH